MYFYSRNRWVTVLILLDLQFKCQEFNSSWWRRFQESWSSLEFVIQCKTLSLESICGSSKPLRSLQLRSWVSIPVTPWYDLNLIKLKSYQTEQSLKDTVFFTSEIDWWWFQSSGTHGLVSIPVIRTKDFKEG